MNVWQNVGYLLTNFEIGGLYTVVYFVDYCRRLNDFGMNLLEYYFGILRQVAKVVENFSRHATQISRIYSGGAKVRKIIRRGRRPLLNFVPGEHHLQRAREGNLRRPRVVISHLLCLVPELHARHDDWRLRRVSEGRPLLNVGNFVLLQRDLSRSPISEF